jgi:hypothetical protein
VTAGANGARGETSVVLAGEPRRLCLTLGALAEIETGLELAGMSELASRLAHPSARDLAVVLAALLRGGGEAEAARDLMSGGVGPVEAAQAVAAALAASAS